MRCWQLVLFILVSLAWGHEELTEQKAVEFLQKHMPAFDHGKIDNDRLHKEALWALKARRQFPWAQNTPTSIYTNNVLPYAVIDEPRDEWREQFYRLFSPLVRDCTNAQQATLKIAANIQQILNVKYSTQRRIPNQGVRESLESGLVSCTGQSILLIAALRSVGIPARMAGLLSWNHIRGNHNWVEAWCNGEWLMIEYNEKSFNTPWVMSCLSMLNPQQNPANAIYATTWKQTPGQTTFFPMIWQAFYDPQNDRLFMPPHAQIIPAIDVTERYMQLANQWLKQQAGYIPGSRLLIEAKAGKHHRAPRRECNVTLTAPNGDVIKQATTPATDTDPGMFLEIYLPESLPHGTLHWQDAEGTLHIQTVQHSTALAQIITLVY